MITFESLERHPAAFRSLTGHSVETFGALFAAFAPAHEQRSRTASRTRQGLPRRRAVGAGAVYRHDLRTRLLMVVVWLRLYPTYEVLGFLFLLNKLTDEGKACNRHLARYRIVVEHTNAQLH